MEELKLLVEMVSKLPSMALWVIAFFFIYKTLIIGSVYGVIKFGLSKITEITAIKKQPIIIKMKLGTKFIDEDAEATLVAQIMRLPTGRYAYIHMSDVMELKEAIDLVIERRATT